MTISNNNTDLNLPGVIFKQSKTAVKYNKHTQVI